MVFRVRSATFFQFRHDTRSLRSSGSTHNPVLLLRLLKDKNASQTILLSHPIPFVFLLKCKLHCKCLVTVSVAFHRFYRCKGLTHSRRKRAADVLGLSLLYIPVVAAFPCSLRASCKTGTWNKDWTLKHKFLLFQGVIIPTNWIPSDKRGDISGTAEQMWTKLPFLESSEPKPMDTLSKVPIFCCRFH